LNAGGAKRRPLFISNFQLAWPATKSSRTPPLKARARNETIFGDSQGNGVSVNYTNQQ
jgi:hypothetical protein